MTRNVEERTWHVHIHALIDSGWISQKALSDAWREVTKGRGYIVDIRKADEGSLDEVVKYLTKGTDFLNDGQLVKEFLDATVRLRMLSTFGYFYGFAFDEEAIEFPPCPVCGCMDKEHYFLWVERVSRASVYSVRRDGVSFLTFNSS